MSNKIGKGLLFAVVFLCLFYACSSPADNRSAIKTIETVDRDSSFPNASQYLLFGSPREASKISDTLSLVEIAMLRDGDILLRRGYGSISDYIADFLRERYAVTHCGFVINSNKAMPDILHTISNDKVSGMLSESLFAYAKQSQWSSLVAVRLKVDAVKIQEVLVKAQELLVQKVPFDMGFDDKDSSSLYCVEMMRDIFLEVYKKDLLPKRSIRQTIDVLSMDNFFDSTYFEIIINHFDSLAT